MRKEEKKKKMSHDVVVWWDGNEEAWKTLGQKMVLVLVSSQRVFHGRWSN